MPTYRRATRVRAPLPVVWGFHSTVRGLELLTPNWLNLRIEAVRGPDGEPDPVVLTEGATVRMSLRPFGVGPRQRWTSRIVDRRADEGAAAFRDVMEDGPFRRWGHTHSFFADGDATRLVDAVDYRLPLGPLGDAAGRPAKLGFEATFRGRHARTRELLDGRTDLDGLVDLPADAPGPADPL